MVINFTLLGVCRTKFHELYGSHDGYRDSRSVVSVYWHTVIGLPICPLYSCAGNAVKHVMCKSALWHGSSLETLESLFANLAPFTELSLLLDKKATKF